MILNENSQFFAMKRRFVSYVLSPLPFFMKIRKKTCKKYACFIGSVEFILIKVVKHNDIQI